MGVFNDEEIKDSSNYGIIYNGIKKIVNYYNSEQFEHIKNNKMYDMFGNELQGGDFIAYWAECYSQWKFYTIKKICTSNIKANWYYKGIDGEIHLTNHYALLKPERVLKVNVDFINLFINGLKL